MVTEVVVLAGGMGTRLRPFTITVPKPLLPLSDRPILEVVLEQLKVAGFRDVCISLGYMAPLFKAFFGDGSRIGLSIEYVLEDEPLGTAGALTLVPDLAENFLVLNGDTLTDLDFKAFLDVHVESGADATILTQKVDEYVDYGVLEFDG
ncbi:MAG: putative sugar-phosphate nucleotide transferase, partial [Enterovirga sp.]|nr:putative sugar-phosphate nucleotide transferase [Enterovirga sp.]